MVAATTQFAPSPLHDFTNHNAKAKPEQKTLMCISECALVCMYLDDGNRANALLTLLH